MFDNDGTLWAEKPLYVQADFVFRRWKAMVEADPEKAKEQPYKALVENDREWLSKLLDHLPELVKGATEAYEGITTSAFEAAVEEFFTTVNHPTLGVRYTATGYRPMRELLDLLAANDFAVYICSGGGRDFMRPVSAQVYGIPRERVIGSGTTLEYRDGEVYRTAGVEQPIDDGPGKPVHIWTRTDGGRCSQAVTRTVTSRCSRRRGSVSSSTTTTPSASSPTTTAPRTP